MDQYSKWIDHTKKGLHSVNETKVVSVALFGSQRKYLLGSRLLTKSVHENLPGWSLVFFVGRSVPDETLKELVASGVQIIPVDEKEDLSASAWRFRIDQLGNPDWVIFRDSDSIISPREANMISQWTLSGFEAHIIRDHPFHSAKILAGLWGMRPKKLTWFRDELEKFKFKDTYGSDQDFLALSVYPRIKMSAMIHTSFHSHETVDNRRVLDLGMSRWGSFCGESKTESLVVRANARIHRLLGKKQCQCRQ
jgi:hypothetical protein